jgi:hypothetical protein
MHIARTLLVCRSPTLPLSHSPALSRSPALPLPLSPFFTIIFPANSNMAESSATSFHEIQKKG